MAVDAAVAVVAVVEIDVASASAGGVSVGPLQPAAFAAAVEGVAFVAFDSFAAFDLERSVVAFGPSSPFGSFAAATFAQPGAVNGPSAEASSALP